MTEVIRLAGGRLHRWVTALRDCNLDGQTFYAGAPQSPLPNGGLPGVVTSVNRWQVWSATGSGSNGYVLAEDYLSVNSAIPCMSSTTPGSAVPALSNSPSPRTTAGMRSGR